MRFLLVLLTFLSIWTGSLRAEATAFSPVQTYRVWKSEKIARIHARIAVVKAQIEQQKTKEKAETNQQVKKTIGQNVLRSEKELQQENWNLEVANDLSVQDYLVLYLLKQPSKNRFSEAAAQMSAREVAEMLEAFSTTLNSTAAQDGLIDSTNKADSASLNPQAGLIKTH